MDASTIELSMNTDRDLLTLDSLFKSYKNDDSNLEDLLEHMVNLLKKHKKYDTKTQGKKTEHTKKKSKNYSSSENVFNFTNVKITGDKIQLIMNEDTREALELDLENGYLDLYYKMMNEGHFDKILLGVDVKKVIY